MRYLIILVLLLSGCAHRQITKDKAEEPLPWIGEDYKPFICGTPYLNEKTICQQEKK